MAGIEFVVVFAMAALDFAVVARSVRTNKLVTDTELCSSALK